MSSVSFDRAASFYDQTRGMPASISDEVASLAIELIGQHACALEIGIGTGRIAKPLLACGVEVVGVDLSRAMMAHIQKDIPQAMLVNGDVTRLPLASATCDAVIAVHILHLVSDWRVALAEARRVLKPEGVLLLGRNHHSPNEIGEMREHMHAFLEARGINSQRIGAIEEEVEAALAETHAQVEERQTRSWSTRVTLAQDIEGVEQRLWSNLWSVPDDALADAVAELRRYAVERFGSLNVEVESEQEFMWKRFRF